MVKPPQNNHFLLFKIRNLKKTSPQKKLYFVGFYRLLPFVGGTKPTLGVPSPQPSEVVGAPIVCRAPVSRRPPSGWSASRRSFRKEESFPLQKGSKKRVLKQKKKKTLKDDPKKGRKKKQAEFFLVLSL